MCKYMVVVDVHGHFKDIGRRYMVEAKNEAEALEKYQTGSIIKTDMEEKREYKANNKVTSVQKLEEVREGFVYL